MGILGLNLERNISHPVFSTGLLLSPQRMLGGSFRYNETATSQPPPFSFWRNNLTRNQAPLVVEVCRSHTNTLGRSTLN